MNTDDSTIRLLKGGAATAFMVLVGLLVAPTLSNWHSHQLAHRIALRIEAAEDAEVKVPLRQLADLGDSAIEPLIVAAASERAAVAAIARQILDEKLAVWEIAAATSVSVSADRSFVSSTSTFATVLAVHIDKFGPTGKIWAESSTMILIKLSESLPARPALVLLEDCTRVLAAIPPRGPRLRTVIQVEDFVEDLADHQNSAKFPVPDPELDSFTRASENSLEKLARLRTIPRTFMDVSSDRKIWNDPRVLGRASSGLNWSPSWSEKIRKISPAQPVTTPDSSQKTAIKRQEPKKSQVIDIPTPQEMATQAAKLRRLSSEELLLRLRRVNFYEAGILRTVLRGRGFSDAELAFQQQLSSPVVGDRLRLVEEVSQLSAAAARRLLRWLMLRWLIDDENAEVRLRALSALGASNAPGIFEIARRLAVGDEDPRVAALASRLLKQARR